MAVLVSKLNRHRALLLLGILFLTCLALLRVPPIVMAEHGVQHPDTEDCDDLPGKYNDFVIINQFVEAGDSRPITRKPDGSVVFTPIFNCYPFGLRFSILDPNTGDFIKWEETEKIPNDYVQIQSELAGVVTHRGDIQGEYYKPGDFATLPGATIFLVADPGNPLQEVYGFKWDFDNGGGFDAELLAWEFTFWGTGKKPSLFPELGYEMLVEIYDRPFNAPLAENEKKQFKINFNSYEDNSLLKKIRDRISISYWATAISRAAGIGGTRSACGVWSQGADVHSDVCAGLRAQDVSAGGVYIEPGGATVQRRFERHQEDTRLVARNLSGDMQVAGPLKTHRPNNQPAQLLRIDIVGNPRSGTSLAPCWSPGNKIVFAAVWDRDVKIAERKGPDAVMYPLDPDDLVLRVDWQRLDGKDEKAYAELTSDALARLYYSRQIEFSLDIPIITGDDPASVAERERWSTGPETEQGIQIRRGPFGVATRDTSTTTANAILSVDYAKPAAEGWIVGAFPEISTYGVGDPQNDIAEMEITGPWIQYRNPGAGCMGEDRLGVGGSSMFTFSGVVTGTPAHLTYERDWVVAGWTTMLNLVYAILVIIVAWMGLTIIVQQHIGGGGGGGAGAIREMVPRLALGLIAAATSYWWCRLLIDLADAISRYVSFALHVAPGDVLHAAKGALLTLGVGAAGAGAATLLTLGAAAPVAVGTTAILVLLLLVFLAFGMLVLMQMILRLVMINLLMVLAPLGMAMWILPHTSSWGRKWLQMWMIQLWQHALQLVGLSLAMSYMRGIGLNAPEAGGATGAIWMLILSIAALYLTYKLPSMLGDGGLSEGFLSTVFMVGNLAANAPKAIGAMGQIAGGFAMGGPAGAAMATLQMTTGLGQGTMGGMAGRIFNVMPPGGKTGGNFTP